MFLTLLTLCAHAHESYGSLSVCLSVCLYVCYRSTDFLRGLYNKMNILNDFKLSSKGFQLRDFSKKLSFNSYSFSRLFSALGRPFLSSRDRKRRTLHTWLRILPGSLGMRCESI